MNQQNKRLPQQMQVGGSAKKRPYSKPSLTRFGDIRTITLAPTEGITESGRGAGFSNPFGGP